jgi:hypothetical protein
MKTLTALPLAALIAILLLAPAAFANDAHGITYHRPDKKHVTVAVLADGKGVVAKPTPYASPRRWR